MEARVGYGVMQTLTQFRSSPRSNSFWTGQDRFKRNFRSGPVRSTGPGPSTIPDAKINCTSKMVTNLLRKGKQILKLRPGRRLVSYDVESLYTNVPVTESINLAAEKLYSMEESPPVNKETFKTLAHLCSSDVLLAYGNGVYIQKDRLAMECKPAPMLANIWFSQS